MDYFTKMRELRGGREELYAKYTDFKKKIMSLFPTIYDTKFLSFELRKELSRTDKWVSNVLNEMYIYFKNSNGVSLALYSPSIKSTNGYNFNGR
uniref:Uncharacterized protein n=1 Tax=Timema douglasi TaxID=61478 RepID=A0A7R8ZCD9_TIMDO|nr:unnamed protein product [Timema douglasi]